MTSTIIKYDCQICGTRFQMGPNTYDGKYVPRYQLHVCMGCWEANWDGWGPIAAEILIPHLKSRGLEIPTRNAKGWLPRE